jgi:hypothetical protein
VVSFGPAQHDFLAGQELFLKAQNTAIAADQERFRNELYRRFAASRPRHFHGHAKADPVALPYSFGAHGFVQHMGRYRSQPNTLSDVPLLTALPGLSFQLIACYFRYAIQLQVYLLPL